MNESKSHNSGANTPFKMLGSHLKYLREQLQESQMEVSGAVEIETETLDRIEKGVERPSEDILLLLIQHYDMQDQEAVQLWELAGYDGDNSPHKVKLDTSTAEMLNNKQVVMLLAMDMRTMYSDGVDININPGGITMNFTQVAGNGKQQPVGRIGMSYEQASMVMKTLEQALLRAKYMRGPQGLPPAGDDKPLA